MRDIAALILSVSICAIMGAITANIILNHVQLSEDMAMAFAGILIAMSGLAGKLLVNKRD